MYTLFYLLCLVLCSSWENLDSTCLNCTVGSKAISNDMHNTNYPYTFTYIHIHLKCPWWYSSTLLRTTTAFPKKIRFGRRYVFVVQVQVELLVSQTLQMSWIECCTIFKVNTKQIWFQPPPSFTTGGIVSFREAYTQKILLDIVDLPFSKGNCQPRMEFFIGGTVDSWCGTMRTSKHLRIKIRLAYHVKDAWINETPWRRRKILETRLACIGCNSCLRLHFRWQRPAPLYGPFCGRCHVYVR